MNPLRSLRALWLELGISRAVILRVSSVALAPVALAWPAGAARIPGGTNASTACFAEFEVDANAAGSVVRCTDCDPACDKDGIASPNGSCTFSIALCLNQIRDGCSTSAL